MLTSFDKNDPNVRQLLLDCMTSTALFAKTFFPEEVESDFSILHEKAFHVIDHPKEKKEGFSGTKRFRKDYFS